MLFGQGRDRNKHVPYLIEDDALNGGAVFAEIGANALVAEKTVTAIRLESHRWE